ncbi:MAG: hypothetical protein EOP05_01445 [Proteobacteria bacterium]|nr:MAG: hypothetical protein EOP05_01445 [Pseudomonadota bacterium]
MRLNDLNDLIRAGFFDDASSSDQPVRDLEQIIENENEQQLLLRSANSFEPLLYVFIAKSLRTLKKKDPLSEFLLLVAEQTVGFRKCLIGIGALFLGNEHGFQTATEGIKEEADPVYKELAQGYLIEALAAIHNNMTLTMLQSLISQSELHIQTSSLALSILKKWTILEPDDYFRRLSDQ